MVSVSQWALAPLVLGLGLGLAGCASLPQDYPRQASQALTDTANTRLARALAPQLARHGARSGAYPLASGLDAFVARMVLAETTQRSRDLQYYIWHGDTSGKLLLDALRDDVVSVRRAPVPLRLVRAAPRSYFEVLRQKLKWHER